MRSVLQWLRRLVGWLGDYQAITTFLPGGILAAIGGGSSYLANLGLHWIIFLSSGIFCFVTLALFVVRESSRANRLEHKLNITAVNVEQIPNGPGNALYRPSFILANSAHFEIFYRLERADYSFNGLTRVAPDPTISVGGLIAPRDTGTIVLNGANGPGIPPRGRLIVDVHYGREKDTLTHSFRTTLDISSMTVLDPSQHGAHMIMRNVDRLDYEKLKA
jgi:hypothetical protein